MNQQEFDLIVNVAKHLARNRMTGKLYEASDLYAAGWQAIDKMDATLSENKKRRILKLRMIDHVRHLRKRSDHKLQKSISLPNDYDRVDYSFQDKMLEREQFDDMIKILVPRDRVITTLYFVEEKTYKQIGEIVGLTESSISYIFKDRIFPTLQKALA